MSRAVALSLILAAALAGCSATATSKHHGGAHETASRASHDSKAAAQRCEERFGETAKIGKISPLRPGYFEVMMSSFKGPRRVACTAGPGGAIVDWVEL